MIPGPTHIHHCPACTRLLARPTLVSGNALGATFWTDGYMEAPMLPNQPAFVKCPWCKAAFWFETAPLADAIHPADHQPVLHNEPGSGSDDPCHAPFHLEPDFDDLFLAAGQRRIARARQRHLRLLAWQAGNHARRRALRPQPLSPQERTNLGILAGLLGGKDCTQRLYVAEIRRELGAFGQAERLLGKPFSEEVEASAQHIRELVSRRDWLVRKYP